MSLNDTQCGSKDPTEGEVIVIEISQAVGEKATTASNAQVRNDGGIESAHIFPTRLGVIAATMPGILALDNQAASITLPPGLLGVP